MTHTTEEIPVLDIKGNSLDDGPGIRSVVFFKGCPLACAWCHNPESRKASTEIAFDGTLCVDCGECRSVCPENALSKSNRYYVDRSRCTLCFLCTSICPSGALERVGNPMTVDGILAKILPDKPFFMTSGGGVTLSGGEATLYMEFVSRLLMKLKAHDIHILLETCGSFDIQRFMALVYPHIDAIYFDIKIMDSADHRKHCGLPNERILDNFRQLLKASRRDGKLLLSRTPLVPGITDTAENIEAIAAFLKNLGVTQAALLAYNPLWHEKCGKVGLDDPYKENKALATFADSSVVQQCKAIYRQAGIVMHE